MDSGEWRYGHRDNEEPEAGGPDAGGSSRGAPNLWDTDSPSWGSAWAPQQPSEPQESTGDRPGNSWYGTPAPPPQWGGGGGEQTWGAESRNGSSAWGGHPAPPAPPAPALPTMPAPPPAPAAAQLPPTPTSPAHRRSDPPQSSPYASASGQRGSHVRTGVDNWVRPDARGGRRRSGETDEYRVVRTQRDEFGDEPAYGPVLGLTAAWYGVPAVFYLIWLITLDNSRQSSVGAGFAASLPWLLAAVVLSLAIAGLLRWAVVGWRAMTLSFASAVIGAGVTTIAHSLTL